MYCSTENRLRYHVQVLFDVVCFTTTDGYWMILDHNRLESRGRGRETPMTQSAIFSWWTATTCAIPIDWCFEICWIFINFPSKWEDDSSYVIIYPHIPYICILYIIIYIYIMCVCFCHPSSPYIPALYRDLSYFGRLLDGEKPGWRGPTSDHPSERPTSVGRWGSGDRLFFWFWMLESVVILWDPEPYNRKTFDTQIYDAMMLY